MAWLSLRAYAKHRGCALSAVQRAIDSGRLSASVALDGKGQRKITDAAVADAEWKATTRAEHVPLTVALRHEASVPPPGLPPPPAAEDEREGLGEARARLDLARAELAELDLAERRKELLPAADVEARVVDAFSHCRTKLLGIPSRVRQRDPSLAGAQVELIETLIREALEDLSRQADVTADGEEAHAA